jgi:formylglycine-generating enzyme required for sulfatase activity
VACRSASFNKPKIQQSDILKTKLSSLLIVAVILLGARLGAAQPTLGVAPAGHQAILFWPATTSGTNGVLLSSTSLTSPNWVTATDAVVVAYGSQPAVSVTNAPSARFFRLSLVPPTPDGMVLIPAGWFTMGDTLDGLDTAVPTNIYVSSFYMDTNLVSYSQWQGVYAYATGQGYAFDNAGSGKADNHPVVSVNWYDLVKWCNARSQQAGLTPCYYTNSGLTGVYQTGWVAPYVNWSANGYRLPTEAEWEKAARGGLSGQRFPWGLTISESQANYHADPASYGYDLGPYSGYNTNFDDGVFPSTSPVGYFAANGYGLYDMAGNVWEWCWDSYGEPYGQPSATDPTGPASGSARVLRAGSWFHGANASRCAQRSTYVGFTTPTGFNGVRCVRRP